MAELSVQERLQPSLLDRLRDDEPNNPFEPVTNRVLTISQFKRSVQRDIAWLLNTTNLGAQLDVYEEVRRSVLNFGIPDLAGYTVSSIDAGVLEMALLNALEDFEPRLLKNSLRLSVQVDELAMSHNTLVIIIDCDLWAVPATMELLLRAEMDFESGDIQVSELSSRSR